MNSSSAKPVAIAQNMTLLGAVAAEVVVRAVGDAVDPRHGGRING